MFDWLRYPFGGMAKSLALRPRGGFLRGLPLLSRASRPLSERRNEYIAQLEHTAMVTEGRNQELEAQLEFKKREEGVFRRIRDAKSRRGKLGELLSEYDTRRRVPWKLMLLAGGAFLLLLATFSQC